MSISHRTGKVLTLRHRAPWGPDRGETIDASVGRSSTANRTLERQLNTRYDFYEFTQEIPSIRIMGECEKLVKMTDDELNELVGNFSKKECQAFIMGTLKGIATSLNTLVQKADKQEENIKKLDQKTNKLDQLDIIQNSVTNIEAKVALHSDILTRHESDIDNLKGMERRVASLETVTNDNFEDLYKSLEFMQRYCEGVDARMRGRNMVILGLGENDNNLGSDDLERAKTVIEATNAITIEDLGEVTVKRLGEEQRNGRARPLHITLESHDKQWKILKKAKDLRDTATFKDIYIKKDIHPAIRKELVRLRKREREEKDNPDNRGITIEYDWKARTLKRNNIIIDRFNPHFQ